LFYYFLEILCNIFFKAPKPCNEVEPWRSDKAVVL
jgi:hypothetical protein